LIKITYKHLTPRKKERIDKLVDLLNIFYPSDNGLDFRAICKDLRIHYLETKKITIPVASQRGNSYYIFIPKKVSPKIKKHGEAHELGHVLLHFIPNNKLNKKVWEDEANYFAERITGITPKKVFLLGLVESLTIMISSPIITSKEVLGLNSKNLEILIEEIESQQIIT
jgi:Zn-dependent peptidase ImmA (M78 family)